MNNQEFVEVVQLKQQRKQFLPSPLEEKFCRAEMQNIPLHPNCIYLVNNSRNNNASRLRATLC